MDADDAKRIRRQETQAGTEREYGTVMSQRSRESKKKKKKTNGVGYGFLSSFIPSNVTLGVNLT